MEGQWHGRLRGRQVLRDPGWTCVLFVKTGGMPEWMPVPVQEEPYERFTLMWTSLSPRCILRDNEEVVWRL